MSQAGDSLVIMGPRVEGEWRGLPAPREVFLEKVSVEILKKQVAHFVSAVESVLDAVKGNVKGFEVEAVEVHAVVTASGEMSLLGIGGGIGTEGGIKFVFTRKRERD